jgi:hypothetical protein
VPLPKVDCCSSPLTYRYNVAREMPSVLQISAIEFCLLLYSSCVIATFLPVSALGLPPSRPLALAACNRACVLSRIKLRSNSASAPKI